MRSRGLRHRLRSIALVEQLGPGLVAGAADDDPSGIATYSQAGAQAGFGLLWTMVLTYPLMSAVQLVSAHIGRVTDAGLAANMAKVLPRGGVSGPGGPGEARPCSSGALAPPTWRQCCRGRL